MTRALRWCAEIAGVAALAFGAWWWWEPLAFGVVGVYLVVIANIGSGGSDNAGTQDSSS